MRKSIVLALGLAALVVSARPLHAAPTVFSASGATAADILATVNAFRADLGVNNGVGPCVGGCLPGVGRREINWDGVPDASSSPNAFPGNFFNLATGNPAGRIRGAEFTTTGSLEVSADSDSDGDGNPGPLATLFGNRHPDNADDFAAFSAERIFGLLGTNQLDVRFSVPGSPGTPGFVRGFGVVFTDVEELGAARLDFFDAQGNLLHSAAAPPIPNNGEETLKSFSFLGVSFPSPLVARVHITNGGHDVTLTQFGGIDAVAMDDFIYGEPSPVPEPTTLALAAIGVGLMALRRVRRSVR